MIKSPSVEGVVPMGVVTVSSLKVEHSPSLELELKGDPKQRQVPPTPKEHLHTLCFRAHEAEFGSKEPARVQCLAGRSMTRHLGLLP